MSRTKEPRLTRLTRIGVALALLAVPGCGAARGGPQSGVLAEGVIPSTPDESLAQLVQTGARAGIRQQRLEAAASLDLAIEDEHIRRQALRSVLATMPVTPTCVWILARLRSIDELAALVPPIEIRIKGWLAEQELRVESETGLHSETGVDPDTGVDVDSGASPHTSGDPGTGAKQANQRRCGGAIVTGLRRALQDLDAESAAGRRAGVPRPERH